MAVVDFPVNFLNYYLARRAHYIRGYPQFLQHRSSICEDAYSEDAYSAVAYFAAPYSPRSPLAVYRLAVSDLPACVT